MNANEVIATLAVEGVHANDDVNMGQSSNDVFPSAVHLATLDEIVNDLLPALEQLASSLESKAAEFDDVIKSGRTHWMDAVPVTLGQELSGYAAQVRQGIARVQDALPRLGQIPLGGTAVGTGLNTHPEFAARVREKLSAGTGLVISPPADPFESQAARDGLVEASGALKVVAVSYTKIANDLRLMGSGPRAGLAEIFLPELQKGSSIMPGKVNPVIPEVVPQVAAHGIGNDTAITVGRMQGHFELHVFVPLLARNILDSVKLLASASRLFAEKCIAGIEANRENAERYAELTLAAATALNPYIGYDRATEIVKEAARTGRSLREVAREQGVEESLLDEAFDFPTGKDAPTGAGQTIVVVTAYGSLSIADDLAQFDQENGLPAPPSFTVLQQQAPAAGVPIPDAIFGWMLETSLDVEYAHAMAPGANIVLAVAATDDARDFGQVMREVLPSYPGSIVTQSFGADESEIVADPAPANALQQIYSDHVSANGTVLASAGDFGAGASFPASSPLVVSVGGTEGGRYPGGLWKNGHYGSEEVWNEPFLPGATGGGPSAIFPAPLWQLGLKIGRAHV